MKMFAVLIARVSTDDQKDALPGQVYRLEDYAKRQNYTHKLFQVTESAYKGNRNDFRIVLDAILAYKDKVMVVFDKIDRYTRDSSSEEVRELQNLYRSGKIELHFPSDNLIIHQNSPATDIMRLGLGIVVAQYYSDAIRDNVKRKIEQKLRDGEWIGNAPMGYKNTVLPTGKKWVEIDALRADIVRTMYEWYATGVQSQREIKRKVIEEYGFKIGNSQVDLVLKNPFYYGEMRVKGVLYPHKYDTVISRDLYDQVQRVREGYKVKPVRWAGLPYSYRGLMSCAECGCRITFEKKKAKYVYGHCTQYKGKHKASYVAEEVLTEQLMSAFEKIKIPEAAYTEISEVLRSSHEDKKKTRDTMITTLDAEIEKYQHRIEKVYEDYLDEKIPEDLYKRKFEEYRASQKSLQNKRINVEQVEDEYYATVTHLLKLAKDAPRLLKIADYEQKRGLINLVLSNLELDGKLLRYKYKKPFDMMAFCHENSSWLRELGSNQRPRS
jgi:site-specific DNA recombinase